MKKVDISIQSLSKIEGHADLDVRVRDGKVEDVKIKLVDNKRFFTQAIRGQLIDILPQSVARICGTCSIAHTMGCIQAAENALGIKVSEQTKALKVLTMHALMIRDHALHVYLFSLPDIMGKDSALDLEGEDKSYLYDSFDIKRAGNKLATLVAGRAVHAPFPQIGGFAEIPNKKDLKALIPELKKAREKLFKVMDLYMERDIDYTRETNFVSLCGKHFDFLSGPIKDSKGGKVTDKEYYSHLEKTVIPYSQALGYKFEGGNYMVGAIARMNLNRKSLHEKTKRDCKKYLKLFPSNNIFHNNIAQAIEIVHCIDDSIDIINKFAFKVEKPSEINYKECEGVSAIEAPRGILYYRLALNADGTVKDGTIITPTQQNQINMELDIKEMVQRNLEKMSKEEIQYEMEKLIRSYDPCISCATHFLRVNWV